MNYELDTYLDALQHFPDNADSLDIARGTAYLIKKDIFKNLMWYTVQGSTKHYPLTLERVKEIKELNKKGVRPDELDAVEIVSNKAKDTAPEFVELVGQISIKTLEKNDRRRRDQQRNQQQPRREPQQQNSGNNRPAERREPQQNADNNRPPQNQQQRPQQQNNRRQNNPNQQRSGGNNRPPNQQQKPPEEKKD